LRGERVQLRQGRPYPRGAAILRGSWPGWEKDERERD